MPLAGRPPTGKQTVDRNPRVAEFTPVDDVPFTDGPKLPPRRTNNRGWPEETKRWWADVSSMPHCALWTPSDWAFARTTALIAGEVHAGDFKLAAELRQREKIMGTTADARLGLRIKYVPVEAEEERPTLALVTPIDELSDLLG
jgi:hypothetical protein